MNRQAGKEDEGLRYKQKKIIEHMGLISRTAQRMQEYIPKEMPWEDVLQYGCVGLVEAMEKYEDGKGKFSTFAGIHIYGSIADGIFQFSGIKRRRKKGKLGLKKLQELNLLVPFDGECIWQYEAKTDDRFERIEEKVSLKQALLSLEEDERDLIDAIYFQRKNWAEYAQEKFMNIDWVYLMHRRVLKKLRKWLKS